MGNDMPSVMNCRLSAGNSMRVFMAVNHFLGLKLLSTTRNAYV